MTSASESESKYLIEIETLQPGNLKSVFGVLKEQINEANITITKDAIEILQMDATHTVVCHLLLKAENFDKYVCRQPLKIGVDIVNLTKVLKGVGSKDILTIFVEDPNERLSDSDATHPFGLLIQNPEKGQSTKIYLDSLDVDQDEIDTPDLNYPYQIYMPSADLQSISNNFKNMGGEIIRLLYHKETLSFFTKGDIGKSETVRSKTLKEDSSIRIAHNAESDDKSNIIELYVKLQKLVDFAKCSSLSPIVTMYLRNDYPLVLEYDVGSLGLIRLGVSQHTKPEGW